MAKGEKVTNKAPKKKDDVEAATLTKLLIKEFNVDEGKTGKIAWCLATDDDNPTDVKEFLSTGSTLLDYICANRRDGGVPVGKLTEISGEEASGKSLICAHLIADCQRRGGIAIYIDTENAANPDFLHRVGVNIKELVYLQPGCVEDVGSAIEKAIVTARAKAPNKLVLVLWDGVAGTPSRAELEGEFDLNMNVQLEKAKIISKMMRRIMDMIGKQRICLVFTNQLKVKIGVMYGDPMTTPGGKGVPYHSSLRIRLEAGGKNADEKTKEVYGIHTRAKIVKSRLGPPWRKCEFDILFSRGIDDEPSWFEKLHERGEIFKKDGWCYLSSVPSGKLVEEGANKGKDLGLMFRESKWKEFLASCPMLEKIDPKTGEVLLGEDKKPLTEPFDVRAHVLNLLQKHMVVTFEEKPHDMDLNPESLMDAESVQETLMEG